MTPTEFTTEVDRLGSLYSHDTEAFHGATDDLMEDLLIGLGYSEGNRALRSWDRWYA